MYEFTVTVLSRCVTAQDDQAREHGQLPVAAGAVRHEPAVAEAVRLLARTAVDHAEPVQVAGERRQQANRGQIGQLGTFLVCLFDCFFFQMTVWCIIEFIF